MHTTLTFFDLHIHFLCPNDSWESDLSLRSWIFVLALPSKVLDEFKVMFFSKLNCRSEPKGTNFFFKWNIWLSSTSMQSFINRFRPFLCFFNFWSWVQKCHFCIFYLAKSRYIGLWTRNDLVRCPMRSDRYEPMPFLSLIIVRRELPKKTTKHDRLSSVMEIYSPATENPKLSLLQSMGACYWDWTLFCWLG